METLMPRRFQYVAWNALGILVFLLVASMSWIDPELPGANGIAPFLWAFTALPIFVVFTLLNLLVITLVAVRLTRFGDWLAVFIAVGTPGAWALAFLVDNAHHGI